MKPIKTEAWKTYLDVGQKLALLAGFILFAEHCWDVGRLPDVELPKLLLLFGASFAFLFAVFATLAFFALFPPFFILNDCKLRPKGSAWKSQRLLFMSSTLVLTEFAVFYGLIFWPRSQWMVYLGAAVVGFIVPVILTLWTKPHWVCLSIDRSIHLDEAQHSKNPVESPAKGFPVFSAFLVWSCCSFCFLLFVTLVLLTFPEIRPLPSKARVFFSGIRTFLGAFTFLFVVNACVEILIRNSSPKNWRLVLGVIGVCNLLLLVFAGPRPIYASLGVGYIRCKIGSVLVGKPAADRISRVLPDAIDYKQSMPVAIQKYEVEIVSNIGRLALLEFRLPKEGSEKWRIFVPAASIYQYTYARYVPGD
jgi:hypothetical protein